MALSLAVDGWQRCFAVKLQSFSQGLPDLLRVCQHMKSCVNSSSSPHPLVVVREGVGGGRGGGDVCAT